MTTPVLQALLLADHVYQDLASKKFVICGVFSVLNVVPELLPSPQVQIAKESAEQPPAPVTRAGSPYAYINLTEVQGQKSLELRYVDLSEYRVLFATDFKLHCDDPLQTIEFMVPVPSLPTIREGEFALELLCENQILGTHRVRVRRLPTE